MIARRLKSAWRWKVAGPVLRWLSHPEYSGSTDAHNGWDLPSGLLDGDSYCIAAGVGEQIDFERSVVRSYGCEVLLLDPTPRAAAFIESVDLEASRLRFKQIGLWGEQATLKFFAPANRAHVSHSIVDKQSNEYFEAACNSVNAIASDDGRLSVDLLKMNIEGAEYEVLESLVRDSCLPMIIAVTFEGSRAFRDARKWIGELRGLGYQVVSPIGWAYTFVKIDTAARKGWADAGP